MSALANGVISLLEKTDTTAKLAISDATGGTPPYTSYQWYRSTTPGFTPGVGNILAGETKQTLEDTGLTPNTTYYYKNVVTDTAVGTAESAQLAVLTNPQSLDPNQFAQSAVVGFVDQRFNYNTRSVIISSDQATDLFAGMAVKQVNPPSGAGNTTPYVVGCDADDDNVMGFIQFNLKRLKMVAGDSIEISMAGNVQYLMATANGNAGDQAVLDLTTGGGVTPATGSTGGTIVGDFYDQPVAGQICRVSITTPSHKLDS